MAKKRAACSSGEDPLHDQLRKHLAALKLTRIPEIYQETLDEAAGRSWSALRLLAHLFEEEANAREERSLERRVRRARLPRRKTLDEYNFDFPAQIAKQKILRIFDCDFVQTHRNVCFIGKQGTGKTHLLTALGYTAAEKGISVRFVRAIDMLNELTAAQIDGSLGKALRAYTTPALLLLDELGYLPVDKRGADLLFQVVAARYETGSIVLTTNRAFRDWGKILDADTTLATALIDRLMHHGDAIVIRGTSYRMRGQEPDASDGDSGD